MSTGRLKWFGVLVALLGAGVLSAELLRPEGWQAWTAAPDAALETVQRDGVLSLRSPNLGERNWNQSVANPGPGDYQLTAEVRCTGVTDQVTIGVEQWAGGVWQAASFAVPVRGDAEWQTLTVRCEVGAAVDLLKAVLLLHGAGTAEFRQVVLNRVAAGTLLPDAVLADGTIPITVTTRELGPVNRRLFGGHYFDIRDQRDAYADMGMTVCREGGPGFFAPGRLRPDGGAYQWNDLDVLLAWGRENQVEILGLFGGAADWMTPKGLDSKDGWDEFYRHWSDFAADVVRHVNQEQRAGVRYWEIWNEPDGGHWFGKPWHAGAAEYAPLYLATARKIKAVDPQAQVGTGGIADPFRGSIDRWWVPVAQTPGVAELIDFVAIHGYYGDPANQIFAQGIDHMRRQMRAVLGREVPLWITEFNVHPLEDFSQRGYPLPLQAEMVAEYLALFAQKEIEAAQYFCVGWWESDFSPWDAATGLPRPVFRAYEFWKDFNGERLAVENPLEATLPAVACRQTDGRRVLYLPARQAGSYRLVFDGVAPEAKVELTAFYGDAVGPVIHQTQYQDGRCIVTVDWPQGARALWKLQVQ